ncbi:hypothetical protein DIZ27_01550 [Streptomyces sp. NWU339]|uniref:DUF4253 domain-containing protein n=1 Tax=Streptomyces sp. NWU339 TaxID=2185284 RepID=UPI000D6780CE|nr:DUF4253 domain-containing protein [Streptomyces sp. NWU339]PWI12301.1 hypothetical protein DIZ27_01550 [Streptomyces sp. NWU339]
MNFTLPEGLPPGRFVSSGSACVWVADELPCDVDGVWRPLLSMQEDTELVPLLGGTFLSRPIDLAQISAVRLEDALTSDFAEYRRRRLPWWTDPTPEPVPEGTAPWPHDPGPPFETWPGLAPATPVTDTAPSPADAAAHTIGHLIATNPYELAGCSLVLAPAQHSADIPALLGWDAEAPLPLVCALLRSWEERFGARVVGMGGRLFVSVARPPQTAAHADLLALEHVLSTADNIVDDPPTPFPEYAAILPQRTHWSFWWD